MSSRVADESITQLETQLERALTGRDHYRQLYLRTLEQCRKLELGLLGQKSERLGANDAQLTMAVLATLLGERPTAGPHRRSRCASTSAKDRQGAGRCRSTCARRSGNRPRRG